MAKGKKRPVLYRTQKFEIKPGRHTEDLLIEISENMRLVWNLALEERVKVYEKWKEAKVKGDEGEKEIKIPTLFDQINKLTPLRSGDKDIAFFPRNWQEETLDRLNGSFLSFFALVKNGDTDARSPREAKDGFFQVIPGRSGFSFRNRGRQIVFMPTKFKDDQALVFRVPRKIRDKLAGRAIKKFAISRGVADLTKSSRYWISITYEIPKPELIEQDDRNTVYVALGASSVGVMFFQDRDRGLGSKIIKFWRPDKNWKSKIDEVEKRLKNPYLTKKSKRWVCLMNARRSMFRRMQRQQRQNHREIVSNLIALGRHFVITDYVVRSKQGKLADSEVAERGGSQGLNWAAQNTGSFLDLVMFLEDKAKEVGGSVVRHQLVTVPVLNTVGHQNKVFMAEYLRKDYLKAS